MNSTGDFLIGGLLSGVGTAITNNANQKRIDALAALKRAYDVEDRNYNATAKIAEVKEQGNQRLLEIGATGQANIATEKVKAASDAANIVLKGNVDLAKDTQIEKLRQSGKLTEDAYQSALDTQKEMKILGVKADHWEIDANGQLVALNGKGEILHYSTGPQKYLPKGKSDSSDEIGDAAAARGGGSSTTPAAPAKDSPTKAQNTVRQQALARLPGLYSQIEQDPAKYKTQYPGMFDANGNLLPIDVLKERINQRYGAQ